jgi:large subunit ribosomal protein L43
LNIASDIWCANYSGFIKSLLPKFAAANPAVEFAVSPRPGRHPVIIGHYINGRTKPICVRNLSPMEILRKAELLRDASGEKLVKANKAVRSTKPSVRGVWSPYHGKGVSVWGQAWFRRSDVQLRVLNDIQRIYQMTSFRGFETVGTDRLPCTGDALLDFVALGTFIILIPFCFCFVCACHRLYYPKPWFSRAYCFWQLMMSMTASVLARVVLLYDTMTVREETLTSWLEGGAANEETIDVGLLAELATVLLVHAATIQDAGLIRDLGTDALKPAADSLVNLLSLLSGSNLASANGPDGLVGNDDLAPVGDLGLEGLELSADNLDGLAGLALLQALAAAPDNTEAILGCVLGLGGDDGVGLVEDGAALGVAENGPGDLAIGQLGDRDLASEGTVGLVEDVLWGDLETLAKVLADKQEVQSRRGNDDLWNKVAISIDTSAEGLRILQLKSRTNVGVERGVVDVLDNLLDRRDRPVPER